MTKLEIFLKNAAEITNNDDYDKCEQICEIGQLCNKFNITSSDLQKLIDDKTTEISIDVLNILYEETIEIESDNKINKLQYIKDKLLNCQLKPETIKEIYDTIRQSEGFKIF